MDLVRILTMRAEVEERGGDSTIEVHSLVNEMSPEECTCEFPTIRTLIDVVDPCLSLVAASKSSGSLCYSKDLPN